MPLLQLESDRYRRIQTDGRNIRAFAPVFNHFPLVLGGGANAVHVLRIVACKARLAGKGEKIFRLSDFIDYFCIDFRHIHSRRMRLL